MRAVFRVVVISMAFHVSIKEIFLDIISTYSSLSLSFWSIDHLHMSGEAGSTNLLPPPSTTTPARVPL